MAVYGWPTASLVKTTAIYVACMFAAPGIAVPTITFPINSQVPPVARVLEPFTFTFSASTFAGGSSLSYTLSNAPSWLSLDGSTRTLSGVAPQDVANTAPIIQITASDDTGSVTMNTTLVVSENPAPLIAIPLEDQLASFGTYGPPSSILYYPSTYFSINFDPRTFGSSYLSYYAVTSDNTPLPSWIAFDGASLSFSGKTPDYYSLVEPPQTWGLKLIASDVVGFAGTAIGFNVIVGNHELDFKDGTLIVNATAGTFLNFTSLIGSLYLDGSTVNASDILSANAVTPDWLEFSNSTFSLSGTPPAGTTPFNVSVTIVDIYEDTASATVQVHVSMPLLLKTASSVNATIGVPFSYNVGFLALNSSDVAISLYIDPLTSWLSFNNQTLNLNGTVPSNIQPSRILVTIVATSKSSNVSNSQILAIMVVSAIRGIIPTTELPSAVATARSTSTAPTTTAAPMGIFAPKKLSNREIAAIIIPLVLIFVAALSLILLWYKRKRNHSANKGSRPNKNEISKPLPTVSQIEEEIEANDLITNSDAYTAATFGSRGYATALNKHSQGMSNIGGGVSMNLRDSRSSGTRGRSYSENALSDFRSTWRLTQENAYPPLGISAAKRSSARDTRNFSRKTGGPLEPTNTSVVDFLGSMINEMTFKVSRSSIQQTPDFAYDSENIKSRLNQRSTQDHLSIPGIGRRLSGIGHGMQNTASGYSTLHEISGGGGVGHGVRNHNFRPRDQDLSREESSWVTVRSSDLKEQNRRSAMSALTESTEVLNSPKRFTLRQVPKSPSQPPTVRLSRSSKSSQPSSKRAVGSSPFFGGSSRTESRGTSRRSLWSPRDKHLYLGSPSGRGREGLSESLEKSIRIGLRGDELSPLDPVAIVPRDSLGITYDTPHQGTRHLRDYVNQLERRVSLLFRGSPQMSDSDSRFRSAEHSPRSQYHNESKDQEDDLMYNPDHPDFCSLVDASPSSFNRDRYGVDESPELSQAIGAQAMVRPNVPTEYTGPSSSDRHVSPEESVQKQHMRSQSRSASVDGSETIGEKSLIPSPSEVHLDDNADISIDGVHGAFL